jgi:hypothetical protein
MEILRVIQSIVFFIKTDLPIPKNIKNQGWYNYFFFFNFAIFFHFGDKN